MRTLVFDIETKNVFEDVGKADPALLDLSIVGTYDSGTDTYQSFAEDELNELWPVIERADLLVGFNSDHFDIPLLDKYYQGDLHRIPSLDLLKEVRAVLGRRIKLDTIAEATLGTKKIGHGLDAIKWWKAGEIEKIRTYCLEDVRITKDIYDYAKANGVLKYTDRGEVRDIPLDTSHWEPTERTSMTGSLPF